MGSFQAKIVLKMATKGENKNYRFVLFLPNALQKTPKKKEKNSKNKSNTIMASFQAEIGGKRMRKRENTNYSFVPSLLDA